MSWFGILPFFSPVAHLSHIAACLQRPHALVCYYQSLQVYQGRGWSLAEDHIYFTIGRQSFYLNDLAASMHNFSMLLRYPKVPSSQESSYLKEYLYTLKVCRRVVETFVAMLTARMAHMTNATYSNT